MKTYFNMKTKFGTETVDHIDSEDFPNMAQFRFERSRLLNEYIMAGMNVYKSQKPCKDYWEA